MAIGATISCSTASGKTLDQLIALIQKRSEILCKDMADACTATVINALVSMRSSTRVAKRPGKFAVEHCGGLYPSLTKEKGVVQRCLRMGPDKRASRFTTDMMVFWPPRGTDLKTLKVYRVTPIHAARKPYYAVASNISGARDVETRRAQKAIAAKGGLAKIALGIAMAKLSTRNEGATDKATLRTLGSRLVEVRKNFGSSEFSLFIHDQLNYAVPAMKKGMTVEIALQKAANRTAGIINNYLHRHGDLEHDIATPFPEVKGHR